MGNCFSASVRNLFRKNTNNNNNDDSKKNEESLTHTLEQKSIEICTQAENRTKILAESAAKKVDNLAGTIKYDTSHIITTARETAEAKRRFMAEGIQSAEDTVDARFRDAKQSMARTSQQIQNNIQDAVQETERNIDTAVKTVNDQIQDTTNDVNAIFKESFTNN